MDLCAPAAESPNDQRERFRLSTFTYSPLLKGQIRLITIIAGGNDDEIQCALTTESLEHDHTCLSYTWGPEQPCKSVYVNGARAYVRENLWNFLHAARRYKCQYKLWIDAICINQADNEEKNRQVRLMAKIYSQASCVMVWLGLKYSENRTLHQLTQLVTRDKEHTISNTKVPEPDPMIDAAWDALCEKSKWHTLTAEMRVMLLREWILVDSKLNRDELNVSLLTKVCMRVRALNPINEAETWVLNLLKDDVLHKILSDGYWSRAWIVQEILLNTRVRMLGCYGTVDLAALYPLLWFMEVNSIINPTRNSQITNRTLGLHVIGKSIHDKQDLLFAFPNIMYSMRFRECTDHRDRIYSILSVVGKTDEFNIDYNSSLQHVMWEVARFLCRNDIDFQSQETLKRLPHAMQYAFECLRFATPSSDSSICEPIENLQRTYESLDSRVYWTRPRRIAEYDAQKIQPSLGLPANWSTVPSLIEWQILDNKLAAPMLWELDNGVWHSRSLSVSGDVPVMSLKRASTALIESDEDLKIDTASGESHDDIPEVSSPVAEAHVPSLSTPEVV